IEGESGTVFLVSADDEAVLVAVASKGAKVGMMLYEVRRAAAAVADVLRSEVDEPAPAEPVASEPVWEQQPVPVQSYANPMAATVSNTVNGYTPAATESTWTDYRPEGSEGTVDPAPWS